MNNKTKDLKPFIQIVWIKNQKARFDGTYFINYYPESSLLV